MGPVSGAHPAQMLGLTDLEAHIAWVAGHDPMSQLELIEFSRPVPRPLPEDWGLQYAGYGFIGLVVPDFEKVLRQFRSAGTEHTITESEIADRSGPEIQTMYRWRYWKRIRWACADLLGMTASLQAFAPSR